jgi:hypothetical protein
MSMTSIFFNDKFRRNTVDTILVLDGVFWIQLARPTCLLGFTLNVKSCMLCVLFLCYLWYSYLWCVSGLIYKLSRSATLDLLSYLGWSSLVKPSLQRGKSTRASLASIGCRRGCWISLLLEERGKDGPICSSTIDTIATQVFCNKSPTDKPCNKLYDMHMY